MTEQEGDELAHALMFNAAHGDQTSLVLMATACVASQFHNIPAFEAMVGAEAFARLAACHENPEGMLLLAGVLYVRAGHLLAVGEDKRSSTLFAEVGDILNTVKITEPSQALEFLTSTLSAAADDADELAAVLLNKLLAKVPPREAARLRDADALAAKTA